MKINIVTTDCTTDKTLQEIAIVTYNQNTWYGLLHAFDGALRAAGFYPDRGGYEHFLDENYPEEEEFEDCAGFPDECSTCSNNPDNYGS